MRHFNEKPDIPPVTPYDPNDPAQAPEPVPLPPDTNPQPPAPVREPDPPVPITEPSTPEPQDFSTGVSIGIPTSALFS